MDDLYYATLAANIERDFGIWEQKVPGDTRIVNITVNGKTESCTLKMVDTMEFTNAWGECVKAVALRDEAGNLYFHYNGTGNGNWGYNAAAYGGGPSDVQTASLNFFNRVMGEQYSKNPQNVYVSGHSQGGNNAQYVTMMSEYGSYIDKCIPLDGPGFSTEAVERMKALYGEDYFEAQRAKIHAYNGDRDYVHGLGQESIVLRDREHTTIIDTGDTGFVDSHAIQGMLDGNGLKGETDQYEPLAEFVDYLNEKVRKLPQEDQERVAELAMKAVEYYLGNNEEPPTAEEWAELLTLAAPVVVEVIAEKTVVVDAAMAVVGLVFPEFAQVYFLLKATAMGILTMAQLIDMLVEAYKNVSDFLYSLTPGAGYADEHPYMRADPDKMRAYADRLRQVNNRLMNLDRDLDSLYWQVGILDVYDILRANMITRYSFRVTAAATFLDNAASKLETAESRALSCMGG